MHAFIAVIVVLYISRHHPNTFSLDKVVICYLIVIAGSIVAFILSFKNRINSALFVVSIVSSPVLIVIMSIITFLLALANGISEP
ncbi:hypothetical protein [Niallia sp. BSM11]|uniref:hypothetical protein n=1 Tax=Niallia sp. BSM11 TaxID=3391576 RepID=UPI003984A23C